jgi:hypothetical protein
MKGVCRTMLTVLLSLKDWDRKDIDLEVEVWVSTSASFPSFIAPVYKTANCLLLLQLKISNS